MERYRGQLSLKDAWTFDHIQYDDIIGSIRDPFLATTESGKTMIPASITYRRSPTGTRKLSILDGSYNKVLYEYSHAAQYANNEVVENYLLLDEDAEATILAVPYDLNSKIFSAQDRTLALMQRNTPESLFLQKLTDILPNYKFGVFGSHAMLLSDHNSDLDLFVHGGNKFMEVQSLLKDKELQTLLGIIPISEAEQSKNVQRFISKYNVPLEQARRISSLRSRYEVPQKDNTTINIAFSACFSRDEYEGQTILGSKKIGKVYEQARVINADYGSTFPRIYQVELDNQQIDVTSMHWSYRNMAEQNDKVSIHGTLRNKNGKPFISLEDNDDRMLLNEK